jgi:uncharacterized phiE125 gp8 family phage protein
MLKLTATPDNPPVSLVDFKAHVHVEHAADDALLNTLLASAVAFVEARSTRVLAPAPFVWSLDCWPGEGVDLPVAPIRQLLSISYTDVDGISQLLPAADWDYETNESGARLWFTSTFTNPYLGRLHGGVHISFEAGYNDTLTPGVGDEAALGLPSTAELAVKFLAAHYYKNREGMGDGDVEIPFGVSALIDQLRIYR